MSQREVLIVLAHASSCLSCRYKLLGDPVNMLRGRALTEEEREMLSHLNEEDFLTPELLARAAGTTPDDLRAYADHALVRLRHFQ